MTSTHNGHLPASTLNTPSTSARRSLPLVAVLFLTVGLAACDAASPLDTQADLALDPVEANATSGGASAADDLTCTGTVGAISTDNVIVPDGARCTLNGTIVGGTIFVYTGATLTARGVDVGGNVQSEGAARVVLSALRGARSVVDGNVQINQGGSATVSQVTIGGDLQMEQNEGFLSISRNTIGANLQVNQNTGGAQITRNTVESSMQCQANEPPPTGSGNQAGDKEDQCASL